MIPQPNWLTQRRVDIVIPGAEEELPSALEMAFQASGPQVRVTSDGPSPDRIAPENTGPAAESFVDPTTLDMEPILRS